MIHGVPLTIHKQNGKMRGSHHHLEAQKFLVDKGKRKGYDGFFILPARALPVMNSPLKLNGE
jgi:hypothetical protein